VQTVHGKRRHMQDQEWLTLREAADALGISEVSARRWVKSGKLKAAQPGRRYLIPRNAVEELLSPKAGASSDSGQPELTEAWKKFYEDLLALPRQPILEQSDEEIALFREAAEKAARGEKPIAAGFLEDEPPERARLAADALRLIEEERRQARAHL
jgi:excisionase family DNA binding protein